MNEILWVQKMLPFMKQFVTIQTTGQTVDGIPLNYDMNRGVLVVLSAQGQMEIPAQQVCTVTLMGETVEFAPVQEAPAPPPVLPEDCTAFERALVEDDLTRAAALESQPGALESQGYSEPEREQIHAALYAPQLPRGRAEAQTGDRLHWVLGDRDGLAARYWRRALPETLPQLMAACARQEDWPEVTALAQQYPEQVHRSAALLQRYAQALARLDEAALLELAWNAPAVLHDPELLPAVEAAAGRLGTAEQQALVQAAARAVRAYPAPEELTPYEQAILQGDRAALEPYAAPGGAELLRQQGYTPEQTVYVGGLLQRLPAAVATANVGRRFGSLQGNIHFLSEKYLWQTLVEAPEKALVAMFSILGSRVNGGTALLDGAPLTCRDAELQQLYRAVVAPHLDQYDDKRRLTLLYVDSLLRTGHSAEALACAEECYGYANDSELLLRLADLAEQTDPARYRRLIAGCRAQAANARPNEFEQQLLQMDRRVLAFASQPERLEAMGYPKTQVAGICTRLAQSNKYPTGNDSFSQYQRLYYIQGNTNRMAERYLRKALNQCAGPAERVRLQGYLFTLLHKDGRYAEAAEFLPPEREINANLKQTTAFAYLRALYAAGRQEQYLQLYDRRAQAVGDPLRALPVLDTLQAAAVMAACGRPEDLCAMVESKWNDAVMLRGDIRTALGELLTAAAAAGRYELCAALLGRFAACPVVWPLHAVQQLFGVLAGAGDGALPEPVWQGLSAQPAGEEVLRLYRVLGMAPAADPEDRGTAAARLVARIEPDGLNAESHAWVPLLWPLLAGQPAAADRLSKLLWVRLHHLIVDGNWSEIEGRCLWLYGGEARPPLPQGFPAALGRALTAYLERSAPNKLAPLCSRYPELQPSAPQSAAEQEAAPENETPQPAPAPQDTTAPQQIAAASQPALAGAGQPDRTPAADADGASSAASAPVADDAKSPVDEPAGQPAESAQSAVPVTDDTASPAERPALPPDPLTAARQQVEALQARRSAALACGDAETAALCLQLLANSACLGLAASPAAAGSVLEQAAAAPPLADWLFAALERSPDGAKRFVDRWRPLAAQYVQQDFTDSVSEIMTKLEPGVLLGRDAQDLLVWAILTNNVRRASAWGLLGRTRALTQPQLNLLAANAALDGAQKLVHVLDQCWKTGDLLNYLQCLCWQFAEPMELSMRLQICDKLEELCAEDRFAPLAPARLAQLLPPLYAAMADCYLETGSWKLVQTARHIAFRTGTAALYYDVFGRQRPILTEKLPYEGCAFLAQLGADGDPLLEQAAPALLPRMRTPAGGAGMESVDLPALLRELMADRAAQPPRCTGQELQAVYGLILPDASNWSVRWFARFVCGSLLQGPGAEQTCLQVLRRFRAHSQGDGFLAAAAFFLQRGSARPDAEAETLRALQDALMMKADEEARTRAPYLQLALLWQQRCPQGGLMEGYSLCDWFAVTAEQGSKRNTSYQTVSQWCRQEEQLFADIHAQAPLLHAALATAEWQDYLTLLVTDSEEGHAAASYLRGALHNAEAHTYCGGASVWHSLARGLLGDMSRALLAGDTGRFGLLCSAFADMTRISDLRPFRQLCAWAEKTLPTAPERWLRWVDRCSRIPLEESQYLQAVASTHSQGCRDEEEAIFRSQAIEYMSSQWSCRFFSKYLTYGKPKRENVALAEQYYNEYLSQGLPKLLNTAIQKLFVARSGSAELLGRWGREYEQNAMANRYYYSPDTPSAQGRALYHWVQLLSRPEEAPARMQSLSAEDTVNLIAYLFCYSDRTYDLASFYHWMLPVQRLACRALGALLVQSYEQYGLRLRELTSAGGADYVDQLDRLLAFSLTPPAQGITFVCDRSLVDRWQARKAERKEAAPAELAPNQYVRLPATKANLMTSIRTRLNRSAEDWDRSEPTDRSLRTPGEPELAGSAGAPIPLEKTPVAQEALGFFAAGEAQKKFLGTLRSLTSGVLRGDTSLDGTVYLLAAEQLSAAALPSAGNVLFCLERAARHGFAADAVWRVAAVLCDLIRGTAYSELEELRRLCGERQLFVQLAALCRQQQRAVPVELQSLEQYLSVRPAAEQAGMDAAQRALQQERALCRSLQNQTAEQDPRELVRGMAKAQGRKLAALPQMKLTLYGGRSYCAAAPDRDSTYLQGVVTNNGGVTLEQVRLVLTMRVTGADGLPWPDSEQPYPRHWNLSAGGTAVSLPPLAGFADQEQKQLATVPFQLRTDLPRSMARRIQSENAAVTATLELRAAAAGTHEELWQIERFPLSLLPREQFKLAQQPVREGNDPDKVFYGRKYELTVLENLFCGDPEEMPRLFLISGQYRMGKTYLTRKLRGMLLQKMAGRAVPLYAEAPKSSGLLQDGRPQTYLGRNFSHTVWELLREYLDRYEPDNAAAAQQLRAHRERWTEYFAGLGSAAALRTDETGESVPVVVSQYEDLHWLKPFYQSLCRDVLGGRRLVLLWDEADRIISDMECLGAAPATNLRTLLLPESEVPFSLVLCGANGLMEYYLRGGSMTQLFECAYGQPLIIGQMTQPEWKDAISQAMRPGYLLDKPESRDSLTLRQLWFYTRGLIHPANQVLNYCFRSAPEKALQPAADGRVRLYPAQVLDAVNVILGYNVNHLHMNKLLDEMEDQYDDLWRSVLRCLVRAETQPYQWVDRSELEAVLDEENGIGWEEIDEVLSNLCNYRGLLERTPDRTHYRTQCELYRQLLREKLLPGCKLTAYPCFEEEKRR